MDSSSGAPVRGYPAQQGYAKTIRTSNIKGTKEQEGDKSNTEVISQLWILLPLNQDQFMDRMTTPKRLRPAISKGQKTKTTNKSSTELER
ncbi:hypothetical protein ISN45_At01g057650 [Arabidopsis thaliana x Arabidopsis arenosa]|uniref:Uncharacterized protein n=1 Tax=Arabidopsis thaliana x Arabidopsis arenosa TaxID=1240361 RepID=A0A8T2GVB3_9BRAS|nr:hypothetical protein ISN45_At01g057650 [Arabidopsis thaliana x Arabidopsis arenosa]